MDKPTVSAQRTIRTFAAGAGCGFLAGAFVVATVVWHFGNVIGSRPGEWSQGGHAFSRRTLG